MKVLCINTCHDSSICLFDSGDDFFQYIKLERILNKKHAYNDDENKINDNYILNLNLNLKEIENLVIIANPNKQVLSEITLFKEINTFSFKNFNKKFIIDHHYSHVLSGFSLIENFENYKWGICIDGMGNENSTSTFFLNPFDHKRVSIHSRLQSIQSSFGASFSIMGKAMKLKGSFLDRAGKIMGAQSYGKVDFSYIKNLDLEKIKLNFYNFTKKIINEQDSEFDLENEKFKNFLATWHKIAELCIIKLFKENIKNKNDHIIYSGGVVQNTVINECLKHEYPNIIFLPHGYDGGLTLGGIYFFCKFFNLKTPKLKNFPYLQNDEIHEDPSEETIMIAANYLSKGLIVGWHQGKGEIGPRALGNRSILMHPGTKNGKDILNSKVKRREYWRPYAASVLEEHAHDWFELNDNSPYMMRAIKTKKEKQNKIESVVHIDGTCRIQTVSKLNNKHFYNLISEFYKITGLPMLLNTSLNDGGCPISGSTYVSKKIFKNTLMDILIVGNKIYDKKNKKGSNIFFL